jgi:hypothetical protein
MPKRERLGADFLCRDTHRQQPGLLCALARAHGPIETIGLGNYDAFALVLADQHPH